MKKVFWRRLTMFAATVAALGFCCGCRNHIEVNGRSCAMLTEREVDELVTLARATMAKKSPKHATAEELAEIRSTAPEIKIDYYGNCLGEAVIGWDLKTRKVEIVYDGQLNSTDPRERDMMLRVMEKQPPVLDFRPGYRTDSPPRRKP